MTNHGESPEPTNDRRSFLTSMLSTGAAVAGASLLTGCATAGANTTTGRTLSAEREAPQWDMSWQSKLGRYKTVFDAPEPQGGGPLYTVALTIAGYKAALPKTANQFTPVLVLRHNATFMTLNDAMWKRTKSHTRLKPQDVSEANVERNPFINYVQGAPGGLVSATSSLTALMKEGTVILACNRALGIIARGLMSAEPNTFKSVDDALAEVHRNLVPGVYPMPNGIFAVAAAQDAGCGLFPSTAS